ncbi:hypothetical protein WA026_006345 [Henosepilachna vigintioctopunctata]|uniref:Peptidase M13 C-terminal domain-containing protein n=1 Tax=Henosepilachna vigintioctopunctata TaxID=420089 RepID=A0AAW1TQB2_9CUCU
MNSTSYLHNVMEIVRRFSIIVFDEPITRNRTERLRNIPENPLTVNAFNAITVNSIIIPLAIVTFPLYDLGLEVLNYGSIGSILGHELIHGFDSNGWQYDKYGSYRQWLPLNLIKIFERKSICFKEQYENATVVGIKGRVSGNFTLSENIADNGGLRHAFLAYRKFRKRFGREAKLPGFENFTNEQMFFIAFGSVWCQNISPELLERLLKSDPHSPNSIRANMAVSNSEDFAEAFKCPKGSKMNPIKKCKIW